jgi:hypothetical protein
LSNFFFQNLSKIFFKSQRVCAEVSGVVGEAESCLFDGFGRKSVEGSGVRN